MRRPAHGATTRPGPTRPGGGFGRPVRPGPVTLAYDRAIDPAWWFERELELELGLELANRDVDRSAEPA